MYIKSLNLTCATLSTHTLIKSVAAIIKLLLQFYCLFDRHSTFDFYLGFNETFKCLGVQKNNLEECEQKQGQMCNQKNGLDKVVIKVEKACPVSSTFIIIVPNILFSTIFIYCRQIQLQTYASSTSVNV
jgi:hypothetical protein